jgi:flagellar protein FlgJ
MELQGPISVDILAARNGLGTMGRTPTGTVTARGAALNDMKAGLKGIGNDREGLKRAAQEFESFLLFQLIKEMRKTVPKNELFHGGQAEDMFQSFLDMEMARELAETGQLGLADMLYEDMKHLVPEAAPAAEARAERAYDAGSRPLPDLFGDPVEDVRA